MPPQNVVEPVPLLPNSTSVAAPFNLLGRADAPLAPPSRDPALAKLTPGSLRDAVPAHCFERSLATSLSYLVRDLAAIAALGLAATQIQRAPAGLAQWALWALYWAAQGSVMTGVWVLAHECGHQAFSTSKAVNDSVGWVLHSALLVPYHSWRISHKNHHSYTCSMDKDEVFVPSTRGDFAVEMMADTPLSHGFGVFVMLLFGWCVRVSPQPPAFFSFSPSPLPPQSRAFALFQARVHHRQRYWPPQEPGQGQQPL